MKTSNLMPHINRVCCSGESQWATARPTNPSFYWQQTNRILGKHCTKKQLPHCSLEAAVFSKKKINRQQYRLLCTFQRKINVARSPYVEYSKEAIPFSPYPLLNILNVNCKWCKLYDVLFQIGTTFYFYNTLSRELYCSP